MVVGSCMYPTTYACAWWKPGGKSKQISIAWIELQLQIWAMIESKQCEDELDLVDIWLDFHSWGWSAVHVFEDETLKKNWTDSRRQLKSCTLSIRSTSSFNDQRNYVASSKYLDKILNARNLLMCQFKSVNDFRTYLPHQLSQAIIKHNTLVEKWKLTLTKMDELTTCIQTPQWRFASHEQFGSYTGSAHSRVDVFKNWGATKISTPYAIQRCNSSTLTWLCCESIQGPIANRKSTGRCIGKRTDCSKKNNKSSLRRKFWPVSPKQQPQGGESEARQATRRIGQQIDLEKSYIYHDQPQQKRSKSNNHSTTLTFKTATYGTYRENRILGLRTKESKSWTAELCRRTAVNIEIEKMMHAEMKRALTL